MPKLKHISWILSHFQPKIYPGASSIYKKLNFRLQTYQISLLIFSFTEFVSNLQSVANILRPTLSQSM